MRTIPGRLATFRAFIRGAMIGLALNLSLVPMAQAQQASPPRPIEPAEIVPIDEPVVIAIPTDPLRLLLDVQQEIYNDLFTNDWNPLSSRFVLDAEVSASGIVTGHSDLGEPFELDVVFVGVPTLDALPPADRERVVNSGVALAGVIGVLRRGGVEVACMGAAITIWDGEVTHRGFIPVRTLDDAAAMALFDTARSLDTDPQPYPGVPPHGFVPGDDVDGPMWSAECVECVNRANREAEMVLDDYERERAAIVGEYNDAVAAAESAYLTAVHIAGGALTVALAAAAVALTRDTLICTPLLAAPGGGTLAYIVCAARALAFWGAAAAIATAAYRIAVTIAGNTRSTAINNAGNTASRRIHQAQERLDNQLDDIDRELNNCFVLHGCPGIHLP